MLPQELWRCGSHRRKDVKLQRWTPLLLLLLLHVHLAVCNVPKDFEQSPQNEDIASMLEEEALISMNKNTSNSPKTNRHSAEVLTFTSFDRKYNAEMNLLSDEILRTDYGLSEYNLEKERVKREIIEGSADVDECELWDVCNGPHEKCNDLENGYECTCEDGFIREDFTCYPEMFLFNTATSTRLEDIDDGYKFIEVSNGIAFSSKLYYTLYISTNGLISFGRRYGPFVPELPTYQQNILCPYWSDLDATVSIAENAGIYYDVYTDVTKLRQLSQMFARYDLFGFNPTWGLTVTWYRIAQYGVRSSQKTVTFQIVLATDGQSTHVLYIYNKLSWRISDDRFIDVGYESSFNEDIRRVRLAVSHTDAAYTNDGIGGNTGRKNVYRFNVGGRVINYAARCYNWYNTWLNDYINRMWAFRRLPICPCNGFAMWWDNRYYFSHYEYRDFTWHECWRSRFNRRYSPLARECCYENGWWLNSDSGNAIRFHPIFSFGQHYEADIYGRENCCSRSNGCRLYNEIRPRRFCYVIFPFFFAWAFGDPHITTLDGKTYIFNGWGEYTMIKLDEGEDDRFVLQARTDLALNKDGQQTSATIFTAFAATDFVDTFNVELNPNKTGLIIYRNGKDLSQAFQNDVNFTESDTSGGLTVSRDKNDVIGTFANGISVRVVLGPKLLTISVGMPTEYKGKTTGLMGNYNGDSTDEFIFPNGTSMPDDSSEAVLFLYGQEWSIDPHNSYLRYPLRKNGSDFAHPNFRPIYYDETPEDQKQAAITACGGDEKNLPCIFDFIATGDQDVADATKQTDQTAVEERAEQANTAPELSSNLNRIEATVGNSIEFAFNATDVDSSDVITYRVIEKPNGLNLAEYDQQGTERNATATWTPANADPVKISVVVQDSKNASSEPSVIEIVMCDKCSGHGDCDFTRTRADANSATSTSFQLAACDCYRGWEGDACETDADGCADNPCYQTQNCTDLTPADEVLFNRTHNCSACPTGFEEIDGKCEDIDECNSTTPCPQVCINTQGSFRCSCNQGFRKVGTECQDIDECVEALHDCEQKCTNTEGNFSCSCESTFDLNSDGKTCTLNETAANPCNSLGCEYGCRVDNSSAECFCQSGNELDPASNKTCKDVDECKQNVCSQDCNNTVGSFACICYEGFVLADDKLSCNKCPTLSYGLNCAERCDCGDRFSECDNVRGCVCNSGWRGTKCDIDVDECEENPNSCPTGQICANNNGSFDCNCPTGYELVNKTCKDINECEIEKNDCSQICTNVLGSFTCSCRPGYNADGANCTDVDECDTDQNECNQKCINTDGSYNCECEFGYQLLEDRATCQQVENVCKDIKNLNCNQGCTVKEESEEAFCFCNLGYKLGADNQTCLDIDECLDTELNKCDGKCENTLGGFTCSCPDGKKLANDKVTCQECDSQHWGRDCVNECGCGLGADRCDNVEGCKCKTGWLGIRCDQDRDECSDESTTCPDNSDCVNNPGSYRCVCRTGYQLNTDSGLCEDIDECGDANLHTCDQICTNTIGSYKCQCNVGFARVGDRCEDIDECTTGKDDCQHLCRNTIGSFACSCRPGFILNTSDRKTCTAQTDCTRSDCSQECQVDGASETCFCNSGFKLFNDTACVDINECVEGTHPCLAGGASCTNKDNGEGYECSCEDGFKLQADGVSCIACEEGKYGSNCASNCSCVSTNTESCMKNNGTCLCRTGWKGDRCQTDINECTETPVDCGANAECKNKENGYICACKAGFFRNGDICEECDSNHWGVNCANLCTCSVNSISCAANNGTCTCNAAWKGDNCTSDVDECTVNTTICAGISNSRCENEVGSYRCDCIDGYQKNPSTNTCEDVEECLDRTLNNCTQECTNTVGAYVCSCSPGYTGTWNDCTDIDECKENGTLCSGIPKSTCKNLVGSYECECIPGYEKNGTVCQDVDECTADTSICDSEQNTQCENTEGNYTCICKPGYQTDATSNLCEDIDECELNKTKCSGIPKTTCQNLVGSYECVCIPGYERYNATSECKDVDECSDTSICDSDPNTECENLPGNYSCICLRGFLRNKTTNLCDDIDECDGNHGCAFKCFNFDNGSYVCLCDKNQVLNLDGKSCDPTKTLVSEVTLDRDYESIDDTNSNSYKSFIIQLTQALIEFFREKLGEAFVTVVIHGIRRGSVIANYSTIINNRISPNPEGKFVKAVQEMVNTNLTVDGAYFPVTAAAVGGTNVSGNLCDAFKSLQDCGPNAVCEVKEDGVPACKALPVGDDYRLIIGLSIGIPVFVVALATIIAVIILRSRQAKKYSSDDEGYDVASRPFASQIPTRGFYNRNRAMYSPDTLSVASSDSDRKKKNGRSSFRDSAWYSKSQAEPQEPRSYDNANFSWDFLYRMMPPNETFEIRRPQVAASESPLRSTGRKNFYSNA